MEWYLTVWRKYAVFTGRARRKEYWLFALANLLVAITLAGLDVLIFGPPEEGGAGVLSGLYGLAVLVPSVAVTVRRLHDTDRSAWWLLVVLVPIVGLVLLVFQMLDGTPGDNRFGPDPKGRTASAVVRGRESDDATDR